MDSGSMSISNYLGETTILVISNGKATASPPENALNDARAALRRERKNPTVSEGNIKFLTEWIDLFSKTETLPEKPIDVATQLQQEETKLVSEIK